MKLDDIIERITQKTPVKSLNEMQQAMAANKSRHTVLLAPTGSGKTLAFAIPMLMDCRPPQGRVQAIVIAPSRELVTQIAEVVRPIALPLKTVAFYGGHSMLDEMRSLAAVPDIIIATPGRLLDHLNRSTIDLGSVKTLVLDEYDKSLELGFQDEMRRICRRICRLDKVILTSATTLAEMPDFLHLSNPETIDFTDKVDKPSGRMEMVEVPSPVRDKLPTLIDLATGFGPASRSIIFVNHRESAQRVYDAMLDAGFPAGIYHGGLDQLQRELAVDMLNNGTTPILIATDLASRGLDIADVQSVVHYHMPPTPEAWTHRNGRTARQGATGTVYIITAEGENIPDYVNWQRKYRPRQSNGHPHPSPVATIYFNGGKKEKISRGDIAGFLMQKGGLSSPEITSIIVKDHCAIAAIPAAKAAATLAAIAPHKVKGQRIRVSRLR